jgi:hypothetical protein
MNRRLAIKNLGMLTGGLLFLPACDFSEEKASIVLNRFQITPIQENLLKDLVATFIPEGEIPGAKSLGVNNFVWIMVDDSMKEENQKSYINGLKIFDFKVKELSGKSFAELELAERLDVLRNLLQSGTEEDENIKKTDAGDIVNFINTSKYYTVWGYMQSEYIMTEIMPYQLVPGSYGSCEIIDINKRINVNG